MSKIDKIFILKISLKLLEKLLKLSWEFLKTIAKTPNKIKALKVIILKLP